MYILSPSIAVPMPTWRKCEPRMLSRCSGGVGDGVSEWRSARPVDVLPVPGVGDTILLEQLGGGHYRATRPDVGQPVRHHLPRARRRDRVECRRLGQEWEPGRGSVTVEERNRGRLCRRAGRQVVAGWRPTRVTSPKRDLVIAALGHRDRRPGERRDMGGRGRSNSGLGVPEAEGDGRQAGDRAKQGPGRGTPRGELRIVDHSLRLRIT